MRTSVEVLSTYNMENKKAPRNRTLVLSEKEQKFFLENTLTLTQKIQVDDILNKTINQNLFDVIDYLPDSFIDLLFLDPPYNLHKSFNSLKFKGMSVEKYSKWIDEFLKKMLRLLKPDASVYFCGDWKSSTSIHLVLEKYFHIRNRITWEREKGRGAQTNWKNNTEDIWFCTKSENYVFNLEDIKLKRRVLAPYKNAEGKPKDWEKNCDGSFRLTHPSNIWTDISVPFWSMPENTEHPTQKPEKLLAKIILASTNEGQVVFDPFLGSGTTSVVAKKLNRKYIGIEMDEKYAALAEKRLELAEHNNSIQGYHDGVFWERNSLSVINKSKN